MNLINTEPALIIGAAEALLILAMAFGVPISSDQKVAIIGAVNAVIAVVGSIVIRSQVTPSR